MSELIYSSAVLTMSQTTEFIRNKSVDNTILNLIIQKGLKEFTLDEAYNAIHEELPMRREEIWNSLNRSYKNKTIELADTTKLNQYSKFKIPKSVEDRINQQCEELTSFLDDSIKELFDGLITKENTETYKELLLDVVTNLMSKYGYAYASQLAGVGDATDFVPFKDLKSICDEKIKEYGVEISTKELTNAISLLFDRRDPCLNNLAFSICNRYYISRLLGLDLPVDFITKNLYENSEIFLDTNIIMTVVYARSKRHNEFREILRKAHEIGISFAVSEITLAELHRKIDTYKDDLDAGSEVIPEDLMTEVQGQLVETGESTVDDNFDPATSIHKDRLAEMGVKYIPLSQDSLYTQEEFDNVKTELSEFDNKYRGPRPPKNENALYHDTYIYFQIKRLREAGEPTSAWFLTLDNSVIEHGISTKDENIPPYSIRLFSLLQTLSQFVESQALKGEFSDMFGELVSKDLLPRDQLFSIDDLKLLIGFDIRAREIPPEFVRKATQHIKKTILKGGEINEKNKSEAIHEFTKFLATPEQNFVEIKKKYDKKLRDRDDDIKLKEQEIVQIKDEVKGKDGQINELLERVELLEKANAKEKYERELDNYENSKSIYSDSEWINHRKVLRRTRIRYIIFISLSIIAFTSMFFIEDVLAYLNFNLTFNKWLKYGIAAIIFLAPYIRSFFEHKKVLNSFRMWRRNFRTKYELEFKSNAKAEYEEIHEKPKLED